MRDDGAEIRFADVGEEDFWVDVAECGGQVAAGEVGARDADDARGGVEGGGERDVGVWVREAGVGGAPGEGGGGVGGGGGGVGGGGVQGGWERESQLGIGGWGVVGGRDWEGGERILVEGGVVGDFGGVGHVGGGWCACGSLAFWAGRFG